VVGSIAVVRLSVIIPTRNRAQLLNNCLEALTRQVLRANQFEVLVVDNGSTDSTPDIAHNYANALPLRYLQAPEPGLHVGRHAGLAAAHANLLVFADDDIVPYPSWLESISSAFTDCSINMVGGNNLPLFEARPPAWLTHWWEAMPPNRRALGHLSILDWGEVDCDIDPGFIWGCNFSIRREVLLAAGGFHPDGLPEERLRYRGDGETAVSDFVRRRGLRARFVPGATVRHRVSTSRMTPEYFTERSRAQGISDSFADLRRHGGALPPLWKVYRRLLTQARTWRTVLRTRKDTDGRMLAAIHRRCATAYLDGYAFHQAEYGKDADFRAWVLKETFLT